MLADFTIKKTVELSNDCTLDLDTHKLTFNDTTTSSHFSSAIEISSGTTTIKGTTGSIVTTNQTVSGTYYGRCGILVDNGATLEMESGNINAGFIGILNDENGTFTMKDGSVSGQYGIDNCGTFTMEGGTAKATSGYGIINEENCTFTMKNGFATIGNDGTFIMENGTISVDNAGTFTMEGGTANIDNAGTFTMTGGNVKSLSNSGEVNITNGIFDVDIREEYLSGRTDFLLLDDILYVGSDYTDEMKTKFANAGTASGYVILEIDGETKYYSSQAKADEAEAGAVFSIGDIRYSTLQNAINAAQADDIINLNANTTINLSKSITVNKNINLNLGEYTLTTRYTDVGAANDGVDGAYCVFHIMDGGTLNVTADENDIGGIDNKNNRRVFWVEGGGNLSVNHGTYLAGTEYDKIRPAKNYTAGFIMLDPSLDYYIDDESNYKNANPGNITLNDVNVTAFTYAILALHEGYNSTTVGLTTGNEGIRFVDSGYKINVNGGTYKATTDAATSSEVFTVSGEEITFTDVEIEGSNNPCIRVINGSTATIKGDKTKITMSQPYPATKDPQISGDYRYGYTAVAVSQGSTLNIEGGEYTSAGYGAYVYSSGGYINLNDGTFNAIGDKAFIFNAGFSKGTYGKYYDLDGGEIPSIISIGGGTFNIGEGEFLAKDLTDKSKYPYDDLIITDGIFDTDVSAYVAKGYRAVLAEDGVHYSIALRDDTGWTKIDEATNTYSYVLAATSDSPATVITAVGVTDSTNLKYDASNKLLGIPDVEFSWGADSVGYHLAKFTADGDTATIKPQTRGVTIAGTSFIGNITKLVTTSEIKTVETVTLGSDIFSYTDTVNSYIGIYVDATNNNLKDITGGAGRDTLIAGSEDTTLNGGEDSDSLVGGTGNNVLDGGDGDDTLVGGSGSDTFVYTSGFDQIYNYDIDNDIVSLASGVTPTEFAHFNGEEFFGVSVNEWIFSFEGEEDALIVKDATEVSIKSGEDTYHYAGEFIAKNHDIITLGSDYNTIFGTTFENKLGFATIDGSNVKVAISISGGDGNNYIIGGSGGGTLDGGAGDDTLAGGASADTFIYNGGNDLIKGFDAADKVSLATPVTEINKVATADGNLVLTFDDEKTLTFEGAAESVITAQSGNDTYLYTKNSIAKNTDGITLGAGYGQSFASTIEYSTIDASAVTQAIEITGNANDNYIKAGSAGSTLDGGAGNDSLIGGSGADIFVLSAGADTVIGYEISQDAVEFSNAAISLTADGVKFTDNADSLLLSDVKDVVAYIKTTSDGKSTAKFYATLADALGAANAGETITLLKDLMQEALTVAKNLTLDTGEFTLSAPVTVNGELTLKGEVTGNITLNDSAKLNVTDATITGDLLLSSTTSLKDRLTLGAGAKFTENEAITSDNLAKLLAYKDAESDTTYKLALEGWKANDESSWKYLAAKAGSGIEGEYKVTISGVSEEPSYKVDIEKKTVAVTVSAAFEGEIKIAEGEYTFEVTGTASEHKDGGWNADGDNFAYYSAEYTTAGYNLSDDLKTLSYASPVGSKANALVAISGVNTAEGITIADIDETNKVIAIPTNNISVTPAITKSTDNYTYKVASFGLSGANATVTTYEAGLSITSAIFGTSSAVEVLSAAGSSAVYIAGDATLTNITGGDGADTLVAGTASAVLDGGAGADSLVGNSGNDLLIGGEGKDTYVFSSGGGSDTIDGYTADDTIILESLDPVKDGNDVLETKDGFALKFNDNDVLTFKSAVESGVSLKSGNSTYIYKATSIAEGKSVTLTSNFKDDSYETTDYATIIASAVTGGVEISSNQKNALFRGGDGADTFVYDGGEDSIENYGEGDIIVLRGEESLKAITDGSKVKFGENKELILAFGDKNSLTVSGAIGDGVSVASGDKTYTYTAGVIGLGADITLTSYFSEPTFTSDKAETINAAAITVAATINGNDKNNYITGSNNVAVSINGGTANDTLKAGSAGATLDGGEGDDLLIGSTKSDVFVYSGGKDTIQGYSTSDEIVLAGIEPLTTPNSVSANGSLTLNFDETNSLTITNTKTVSIKSGDDTYTYKANEIAKNTEGITLGSGHEAKYDSSQTTYKTIDASAVTNAIAITGNNEGNYIIAGSGGGTINAGSGDDTLVGGAGPDTFVFTGGKDVIENYGAGDQISVKSGDIKLNYTDVSAEGSDLVLGFGGENLIIAGGASKVVSVTSGRQGYEFSKNYIASNDGVTLAKDFTDSSFGPSDYKNIDASDVEKPLAIAGNKQDNYIIAGTGGGTINADTGNDKISLSGRGSEAAYTIEYTAGKDTIIGFNEKDALTLADVEKITGAKGSANKVTFTLSSSDALTFKDSGSAIALTDGGTLTSNGLTKDGTLRLFSNAKGAISAEGVTTIDATAVRDQSVTLIGSENVSEVKFSAKNKKKDAYEYNGGTVSISGYEAGYDRLNLGEYKKSSFAVNGDDVVIQVGESGSITLEGARDSEVMIRESGGSYKKSIFHATGVLHDKKNATSATIETGAASYEADPTIKKIFVEGASGISVKAGERNNTTLDGSAAGSGVTLVSGKKNDKFLGSSNEDTFVYTGGKDVIDNYDSKDTILFNGDGISMADLTKVTASKKSIKLTFKSSNNTLTIKGNNLDEIKIGEDKYSFRKNAVVSNNVASLTSGASGTFKADNLNGVDASNVTKNLTIVGRNESDALKGGGKKTVLKGNGGNDILTGGVGKDTFFYAKGESGDVVINDFEFGTDNLNIANGTIANISSVAGGVRFSMSSGGRNNSTPVASFEIRSDKKGEAIDASNVFIKANNTYYWFAQEEIKREGDTTSVTLAKVGDLITSTSRATPSGTFKVIDLSYSTNLVKAGVATASSQFKIPNK